MPIKKLDPQARLEYVWDFDADGWMPADDYITSYTLIPETGITFDTDEAIDSPATDRPLTAVRAWVEWDSPTMPADGTKPRLGITCRIETWQGRRDDKTMHFLYLEG
jgi:hypothetical protein